MPNDAERDDLAVAYIDGQAVTATREQIPVVDPAAHATVVGYGVESTTADVDRAAQAAARAGDAWGWQLSPAERAEFMLRGAEALEGVRAELAGLLVREVGKPLGDCRGDIGGAIALMRSFADLARGLGQVEEVTGEPGTGQADEVLLQQIPAGPAAIITPWNTPIYLCINAVAPALAAGCTVIVKPPEAAPLALTRALHLVAAQLPAGVLNVVPGKGQTVGAELTAHPLVRVVSATGGISTGSAILKAAAPTIKKVALELGGNDAALVLEDADLSEAAVRELVAGTFAVSGQVCFAVKRIYVHESRIEEFLQKFRAMVDQIVVGPGDTEGVHMGPMTTEAGWRNAKRLLEAAASQGNDVHTGGVWAEGFDPENGWFVKPAVVTGVDPRDPLVLEEQFAPIIPVLPFTTEDEAILAANDTEYGLASSVWSADPKRAVAVALRLQAGNTFINAHRVGASVPRVPFGGVKQSGLGRNHLHYAIAEFTEEHATVRYTSPEHQIGGLGTWGDLSLTTH